jgi:hypothetical protein
MIHRAAKGKRKRRIVSTNLFVLPAKVADTSRGMFTAQQQNANQQTQRYDENDRNTINRLRPRT